jgi:hypothetical protein
MDQKVRGCESPISVFYFHLADDTMRMPAPRGFLVRPLRLFE